MNTPGRRVIRLSPTRERAAERSVVLPVQEPGSEGTLRWWANSYHQWMLEMNYSAHTIKNHRCFFGKFLSWCEPRSIETPYDVTQELIERFQRGLYYALDDDGKPLTVNTQRVTGLAIHAFFRWMKKRGHMRVNPAADIELPRAEQRLPKYALTVEETEKVLAQPSVEDPVGLRDRAILEVFYSTGIRREELSRLKLYDLDARQNMLMVRQGKGKRDRLLPIGDRALMWLDKYIRDARPVLVCNPDHGYLFVMSKKGTPISPKCVGAIAKACVDKANIGKKGACHLFRHAMATHLLDAGADVKMIQAMLGHKVSTSTDAYANMSVRKLLEVHAELHPAQLVSRPARKQED